MIRIRTFIAIDIDEGVRERMIALQEKFARIGSDVKWVEPKNQHVTLLFLGDVDSLDVVKVCRVVQSQCAKVAPFSLSHHGVGAFPNTRRPKILWTGITDGLDELVNLHTLLEEPLLELGCYRREARPYSPHLTLGRVTKEDAAETWGPILTKYSEWDGGTTIAKEVLVMSSELRREGPFYSVMGRAPLTGRKSRTPDDEE